MKNDRISRNFTYSEFERSDTAALHGIDNTIPDDRIRRAVRLLVGNVLQPLRDAMRVPLRINSGYRSSALNTLLRGARNSQHTKGEAADIAAADPLLLAQTVIRNRLPFDQMILYSTFVHISHKPDGPQRGQKLYDSTYKEHYPDTL